MCMGKPLLLLLTCACGGCSSLGEMVLYVISSPPLVSSAFPAPELPPLPLLLGVESAAVMSIRYVRRRQLQTRTTEERWIPAGRSCAGRNERSGDLGLGVGRGEMPVCVHEAHPGLGLADGEDARARRSLLLLTFVLQADFLQNAR